MNSILEHPAGVKISFGFYPHSQRHLLHQFLPQPVQSAAVGADAAFQFLPMLASPPTSTAERGNFSS